MNPRDADQTAQGPDTRLHKHDKTVLDLISRKTVMKDVMKKLYADDLALVANGKQELQETLDEWNGLFTRHGLKRSLEKMEVLHIGHQREELDIELEGKK